MSKSQSPIPAIPNEFVELSNTKNLAFENTEDFIIGPEVYKVCRIGNQLWLTENLRNDIGGVNINNDPSNRTILGKLYTASEAISIVNSFGVFARVPSDNDFKELERTLGMIDVDIELVDENNSLGRGYSTDYISYLKSVNLWNNPGNNHTKFNLLKTQTFKPWLVGSEYDNTYTALVTETIQTYSGGHYYRYYRTFNENNNFIGRASLREDMRGSVRLIINDDCTIETFDKRKQEETGIETIIIGNQEWTRKNYDVNTANSLAYNNNESNVETYGRLYTASQAVLNAPEGFRLPTEQDFIELINFVGSSLAGFYLKARSTNWNNEEITTLPYDKYGFAMQPSGLYTTNFFYLNYEANLLCSSGSGFKLLNFNIYNNNISLESFVNIETEYHPVRYIRIKKDQKFDNHSPSHWRGNNIPLKGLIGNSFKPNESGKYIYAPNLPTLTSQGNIFCFIKNESNTGVHYIWQQGISRPVYGGNPTTISHQYPCILLLRFDLGGIKFQLNLGNGNRWVEIVTEDLTGKFKNFEWNSINYNFNINDGCNITSAYKVYLNGQRVSFTITPAQTSFTSIANENSNFKILGNSFTANMIPTNDYFKGEICKFFITKQWYSYNESKILKLATVPSVLTERIDIFLPTDYEFLETFTKEGTDAPGTLIDSNQNQSGWHSSTKQLDFPIGNSIKDNIVIKYNSVGWDLSSTFAFSCFFKIDKTPVNNYTSEFPIIRCVPSDNGYSGRIDVVFARPTTANNRKVISIKLHSSINDFSYIDFIIPDDFDITRWHHLHCNIDLLAANNQTLTASNIFIDARALVVLGNSTTNRSLSPTVVKQIRIGGANVSVGLFGFYLRKFYLMRDILDFSRKIMEVNIDNDYQPVENDGVPISTYRITANTLQKDYSVINITGATDVDNDIFQTFYNSITNSKLTFSCWIQMAWMKANSSLGFQAINDNNSFNYQILLSGFSEFSDTTVPTISCFVLNTLGNETHRVTFTLNVKYRSINYQKFHLALSFSNPLNFNGLTVYINGELATTSRTANTWPGAISEFNTTNVTKLRLGWGNNRIADFRVYPLSYNLILDDVLEMLKAPPTEFRRVEKNNAITIRTPEVKLLRLREAEVSMLCRDGTDGKNNQFKLTPVFSYKHSNDILWSSTDEEIAVVNEEGIVSATIGSTKTGNVIITANYNGIIKQCLFTIYNTLPTLSALEGLKGGTSLFSTDTSWTLGNANNSKNGFINFFACPKKITKDLLSFRCEYSSRIINTDYTWNKFIFYTNKNGSLTLHTYGPGYLTIINSWFGTDKTSRYRRYSNYDASMLNTERSLSIGKFTPNIATPTSYTSWFRHNTTEYTLINSTDSLTGVIPYVEYLILRFNKQDKKTTLLSFSSNNTANKDALLNRLHCDFYYICQNYVKYSATDEYENLTKILNMGLYGSTADLIAVNVPSYWFGITPP